MMPPSKPGAHHVLCVSFRHHALVHAPSSPGFPAIGAEGTCDLSHWDPLGTMMPCGSFLCWGREVHSSNALGGDSLTPTHSRTQPAHLAIRLSTRVALVGSTRDPMSASWSAWGAQYLLLTTFFHWAGSPHSSELASAWVPRTVSKTHTLDILRGPWVTACGLRAPASDNLVYAQQFGLWWARCAACASITWSGPE